MSAWLDRLVTELSTGDEVGWLVSGSVARGEEHAYSDVDLTRFTVTPPSNYRERYALQYWQGRLVSVMNRTVQAARADLESPQGVIWAVEGLRQAKILRDPTGALQALQEEAIAFDWAPLRAKARDWVSYQVAHAAEEVQKLLGLRQRKALGGLANAAMGLNLTIGYAMAVDREVLFRSENRWIDQVIEAVGPESPWAEAFRQSLGLRSDGIPAGALAMRGATTDRAITDSPPSHAVASGWQTGTLAEISPIWAQSAGALQLYHESVILLAERMHEADRAVALEAVARIQREAT